MEMDQPADASADDVRRFRFSLLIHQAHFAIRLCLRSAPRVRDRRFLHPWKLVFEPLPFRVWRGPDREIELARRFLPSRDWLDRQCDSPWDCPVDPV